MQQPAEAMLVRYGRILLRAVTAGCLPGRSRTRPGHPGGGPPWRTRTISGAGPGATLASGPRPDASCGSGSSGNARAW
jgi:hypothetical protein